MLITRIATSVAIDAGSWISVVKTNVASAMPAVASAMMRMLRRAPVSARMRRWPIVTRQKMASATALPIEAIADRS